ncbi:rhomboid family intramembrane serine protease [Maribacter sp. HTCC2170]|uniref:rhomboid family intramembrane serine protease n=1 Tax=Maribacter sp. (strain HTCC2170 / KCCM 42371) TaxID=313603 RepID=UPI00006B48F7|nr:rhomboid family intramembrane serine protease [Maribacter sp. HTCC2170]EAR01014.1 putative transmembrane rhomboid family protein [Maribacter sp. HTCC2170]
MANGNLKYQFARLSVAEKLIAVNILIFIINGLFTLLFRMDGDIVVQWFQLPKDFFDFLTQPWSIITYSFFHAGLGHIFWNMLVLYFVGRIFLNLFNGKRFLNVYFLGVILGGLFFMVSYNVFPAFFKVNAALIGASAGVRAILIFICAYIPNQEVRLIVFNIKLWYIGAFIVLTDLVQLSMGINPGGQFAHLGGALLGYVYARQLLKGKDIGEGFSRIVDSIANLFKKSEKKAPLKTVYRSKKSSSNQKVDYKKESHQRKIDIILDKISKSGYESLSKAEKDFLFKAGKED